MSSGRSGKCRSWTSLGGFLFGPPADVEVIRSRFHDNVVLPLLAGNFSMVTVMDYDETIQKVLSLLVWHIKGDAYIGQEPYKADFFKVFKEAYRGGYCDLDRRRLGQFLTADSLTEIINTRSRAGSPVPSAGLRTTRTPPIAPQD